MTAQSLVMVDTRGRLVDFRRVPPQRDADSGESAVTDWNPMFRAAGRDPRASTPVPPDWTPKDYADTRVAWEGASPDAANMRLRVEAVAYRGRITSVYVLGPWSHPRAQQPVTPSRTTSILRLFALLFMDVRPRRLAPRRPVPAGEGRRGRSADITCRRRQRS